MTIAGKSNYILDDQCYEDARSLTMFFLGDLEDVVKRQQQSTICVQQTMILI